MDDVKKNRATEAWKPFLLNVSIIVALFLVGIFVGFTIRTNSIIEKQFVSTARSHFKNIVLTRRWNANYGGVFVKKTEGVVSNPYLKNPDIETIDGVTYTKKNPALMTREISEYAAKDTGYRFHITSLRPLNPHNTADEFEKTALASFEKGTAEAMEVVQDNGYRFRYMAPLMVEASCLQCHAEQGYHVGDVRGGISVSFDITDVKHEMSRNRYLIAVLTIFTTLLLLAAIYFLVARLSGKLNDAYETIEYISITDGLTKLFNRMYFQEKLVDELARAKRYQHFVSLIMLDIDFFKRINDSHGHQAGDEILIQVSALIKNNCRGTDFTARYGGEEIVVILPETDLDGAARLAEKLRTKIEEYDFDIGNAQKTKLTISLGVSCLTPEKNTGKGDEVSLVGRADAALYRAKENGRNRVEVDENQ